MHHSSFFPRVPLISHKKERRLGSAEVDCTLPAKVDRRSGKEGDTEYVAADDNGVFSPRRDGSLYVIGTRWLAEGALNPILHAPVTGTREFPDGTH